MTEKTLYITIFGMTVPADWLRDDNLGLTMKVGSTLPVELPPMNRHISTLKSYGIPGPSPAGDSNVD